MHELDAGENGTGSVERFEVQHRLGHPLNSTVVLLDDVVEVLDLAHDDRNVTVSIDRIDGRLVGAALIQRDLVRSCRACRSLSSPVEDAFRRSHVALCGEQEVDSFSVLVDSAVKIFPDALDLNVCLTRPPTGADRALVFAGHFLDERQETGRPSVDR